MCKRRSCLGSGRRSCSRTFDCRLNYSLLSAFHFVCVASRRRAPRHHRITIHIWLALRPIRFSRLRAVVAACSLAPRCWLMRRIARHIGQRASAASSRACLLLGLATFFHNGQGIARCKNTFQLRCISQAARRRHRLTSHDAHLLSHPQLTTRPGENKSQSIPVANSV